MGFSAFGFSHDCHFNHEEFQKWFWSFTRPLSPEGKLFYFIYKVCEKIATEEQDGHEALDHSPILVEKSQISVIFSSMAIMSGQIFMKMILCTFVNIYSDNLVCSWYQIIYGMIGFAKKHPILFRTLVPNIHFNLGIIQRERGKKRRYGHILWRPYFMKAEIHFSFFLQISAIFIGHLTYI